LAPKAWNTETPRRCSAAGPKRWGCPVLRVHSTLSTAPVRVLLALDSEPGSTSSRAKHLEGLPSQTLMAPSPQPFSGQIQLTMFCHIASRRLGPSSLEWDKPQRALCPKIKADDEQTGCVHAGSLQNIRWQTARSQCFCTTSIGSFESFAMPRRPTASNHRI
jgi:hypothetical protein